MRHAAVALALTLIAPVPARGHGRSLSYSTWEITPEGARVEARIARLDLSRLGGDAFDAEAAGAYLATHLEMWGDGRPCPLSGPPRPLPSSAAWASYGWEVGCRTTGPVGLASSVLRDAAPSHLHFARVTLADGRILERVLDETEPGWELGGAAPAARPPPVAGTSFGGYVRLGVHHILSGFDHLAFVLALLLIAGSLREVAGLVTAFTIAHSLTLGLAVLGAVRPEPAAVEALIGCSILLVAAENVWLLGGRERWIPAAVAGGLGGAALLAIRGGTAVSPVGLLGLALFGRCHFALLARAERPERLRAAAAFAFGLLHGLGFAGVLATLALPRDRLVPALLGFNLGVEVGQLGFVALLWPPLRLLGRTRWAPVVAEAGSAAAAGLGVFWLVSRTWG